MRPTMVGGVIIQPDQKPLLDQYGPGVYMAARALYNRLRGDPIHGREHHPSPWNSLQMASAQFWCECAKLVLQTEVLYEGVVVS